MQNYFIKLYVFLWSDGIKQCFFQAYLMGGGLNSPENIQVHPKKEFEK